MNDYTKYSKNHVTENETVEEVQELVTEIPVAIEEVVPEELVIEEFELIPGTVSGCKKLNVRENPSFDADVVCVIPEGCEVEIDESNSTDEFYKVYTAAGMEGYCMKKFISVN